MAYEGLSNIWYYSVNLAPCPPASATRTRARTLPLHIDTAYIDIRRATACGIRG